MGGQQLEIDYFQMDDLPHLRDMTHNSFLLNSFNVDQHLPRLLKGELFFENMAKKAMQHYQNSCLVAYLGKKPVGYIIHGVDRQLAETLGELVGTVILFCVADEAQGKGVGKALLDRSLLLMRSGGVRLVTVGTDGNNTAALNLYQQAGFRTRMNWGTWRFYPKFPCPQPVGPARFTPFTGEKGFEDVARGSERPIAFFQEKSLPQRGLVKLRRNILETLVASVRDGSYGTMLAKADGALGEKIVGLLTWEQEGAIERFFNAPGTRKRIFRINDLVVHKRFRGRGIGAQILATFVGSVTNYHFIEIWAAMDNWPLLNALSKAGFRLSHLATVLHYRVPD